MHEDVGAHLDRLDEELDRWAARVRDGMDQEEFVAAAQADVGADADVYDQVAPFWQSWHGLRRYWDKRSSGLADDVRAGGLREREHDDLVDVDVRRPVSANMMQSATSSACSGPPSATFA